MHDVLGTETCYKYGASEKEALLQVAWKTRGFYLFSQRKDDFHVTR